MDASPNILQQLEALLSLVRELGHVRDPAEIYEPTLTALAEIAGVERSAILLLDDRGVVQFVAWRGLSDEYRAAVGGHFPWRVDDPAPRPILIDDVAQHAEFEPLAAALDREGIRALAFIPLMYRGRLIGKFMLYFGESHAFSREETELALTLAYLVAFAIERTRLHAALEESDRRKDVFLATLAHELRNPLAPISASIELLDEQPNLDTLERVRGILARSVHQITKLVDDLLDVSRITRGMVAIDKRPVDLTSLVHHAIMPVKGLITAKRQVLTLSLDTLMVEADSLRLEQVVTNLVHNAAKYTPENGHIWVITRASDGGVEIRIRDDGIGIDRALLPRLFDLFMQADKSLARSQGGLGVGLTIVRELVQLHGGSVRAESRGPSTGSEFIVWLPERIETRPMPSVGPTPAQAQSRTILVVDDNDDALATLGMLLLARGHHVITARDGMSALEKFAEQRPQVVLLDLGLPDISGYEVARRLRAGDGAIRIIALSGYGQPDDVARSADAGCDSHLVKPVDIGSLERALSEQP